MARSAAQANLAFFQPMTVATSRGWFADHCEPKVNLIVYDKGIEAISGHSAAESQEGLNLILAVADEVDAFQSKEFVKSHGGREPARTVEGILDMLRTSGSTRFPQTFKNVRISYPRYLGSTIQRLRQAAERDVQRKGERSGHYVSGPKSTWDVNPRFDRFDRVAVPGTDVLVPNAPAIVNDYEEDPVLARAKYECRPARAISPYFRNTLAVEACFRDGQPTMRMTGYRPVGSSWEPEYEFDPGFRPVKGARYAMHGDLALNGDAAGVAMAHVVDWTEQDQMAAGEHGEEHVFRQRRPNVKVDFVIAYTADIGATPAREIQIRWGRLLAFELTRRGFNVRRFTFDGYESVDSRQILESKGIEAERVSTDLSTEPWRNLRDVMYEGRLEAPWLDSVIWELLGLDQLSNGKVDHAVDGKKDQADALACSVQGAVELGGEESGEEAHYVGADITVGTGLQVPGDQWRVDLGWVGPR